jgi:hypothetical protein
LAARETSPLARIECAGAVHHQSAKSCMIGRSLAGMPSVLPWWRPRVAGYRVSESRASKTRRFEFSE